MSQGVLRLVVVLSLAAGGAAHAHPGPHADIGLAGGLAHLLSEPDHLFAIAAAGLAAIAMLRARSTAVRLGGVAIIVAGISFVLLV